MIVTPLLIVDMLNDFFGHPRLAACRNDLVRSTNSLIDAFRAGGHPVVWVRQEFRSDLSDAFLEMRQENIRLCIEGTIGARILSDLAVQGTDIVIVKKRYSAFFGTNLDNV